MREDVEDRLRIVRGSEVLELLSGRESAVLDVVARAYVAHDEGASSLPHSTFLRFPDEARDRIIALPAYLGGDGFDLAGVKWIASIPANIERGLERASAAILVNDRKTGRPRALVEGSVISARRTAASAALAARELLTGADGQRPGKAPETVALIGCGPIQFEICRFLLTVWPQLKAFTAFDLRAERAAALGELLRTLQPALQFEALASAEATLASAPLVSFATTAVEPHVGSLNACVDGAVILHISLRDLEPDVILDADNVVDDADHVCRAGTSIHLAAEQVGHRDFIRAPIGAVLRGSAPPRDPGHRLTIYSPFGLGVLDLAVAHLVLQSAREQGVGTVIENFLPLPWNERGDGGSE